MQLTLPMCSSLINGSGVHMGLINLFVYENYFLQYRVNDLTFRLKYSIQVKGKCGF
jgi:hypothetical protein